MKFVLKTSQGGYFERIDDDILGSYIITSMDKAMAKEFTLNDIRNGVINDLVYKASTRYGLHFSVIQIEEDVEIPKSYQEIFDVFKGQLSKGVEKYGQNVDKSNLSAIEWIDHSLEEIADLMVYLVKFKEKLKELSKNE